MMRWLLLDHEIDESASEGEGRDSGGRRNKRLDEKTNRGPARHNRIHGLIKERAARISSPSILEHNTRGISAECAISNLIFFFFSFVACGMQSCCHITGDYSISGANKSL